MNGKQLTEQLVSALNNNNELDDVLLAIMGALAMTGDEEDLTYMLEQCDSTLAVIDEHIKQLLEEREKMEEHKALVVRRLRDMRA